jgi:hypothetical protein
MINGGHSIEVIRFQGLKVVALNQKVARVGVTSGKLTIAMNKSVRHLGVMVLNRVFPDTVQCRQGVPPV